MTYDKHYFESGNYKHYTSGWYRFWHWVKFTWVGLQLRALRCNTVLDFGCADGVSVAAFRRMGLEAWGVDISDYALSRAPAKAAPYLWQGGLRGQRFPPKHFDVIVSWDVLEHIAPHDLDDVLRDLKRLGRRGLWGIYVTDEWIARLHLRMNKRHPDHLSEHPAQWWRAKFGEYGFRARRAPLARGGTFWVDLGGV